MLVFAAGRGDQLSYEVLANQAAGGTRSARGLDLAWEGQPPTSPPIQHAGHAV